MQKPNEKIQSAPLYEALRLLRQKKFAEAEKSLSLGLKAAEAAGDDVLAAVYHSTYGIYFKLQNDFRKAWKCYEKAEKLLPDDPSLKLISARLLVEYFGQYDAALKKMEKVLELAAGNPIYAHAAHTLAGLAWIKKGNKKEAALELQKSMDGDFKGLKTASNLDFTLIEAMMRKKTEPELCRTFLETAFKFAKKNREAGAQKVIQKLLDTFPDGAAQ